MLYLAMPIGSAHGWGICGKYIAREMAGLEPVRLISDPFTVESVGDELEYRELARLTLRPEEAARWRVVGGGAEVDGPLLMGIGDKHLLPMRADLRGRPTLGYTFFEDNKFSPAWIENGRRYFDRVITGSSWCTEVLRSNGLANAATVLQGIDPAVFYPMPGGGRREFLADRFAVFSGGKFELRKGQDVAIRAYKVLQDRHEDVMLVNSWHNPWAFSFDTMRASPLIRMGPQAGAHGAGINQILADNGIDVGRVVTLLPRPNHTMARIYRNTDVGIFPNRCEGGTNLVLMEYMACGKPVVATASTGHANMVNGGNALTIGIKGYNTIATREGPVATWPEPDVEEAIEKLEWAYQHREELRRLGEQAGREMGQWTWRRTAEEFCRLLHETGSF